MHCGYADDINFLSSGTLQKLFNPEHSRHLRAFFRLISSLESIESQPHINLTFINYVIVVIVHRFEENHQRAGLPHRGFPSRCQHMACSISSSLREDVRIDAFLRPDTQ